MSRQIIVDTKIDWNNLKMSRQIIVDTKIDWNNLLIVQDTYSPDFEHTIREVVNTKEDHIRKALIQMGWTPPKENR